MPEFLKTIPHEYLLLPNIKGSDAIWGVNKNWSLEEAKHKLTPDRYISCCYNLKDTNYAVIDIDTDDYSLDQLFQDTEIDSCYVKGNTKGLHVWVDMEHGKEGKFKKNIVNCGTNTTIDYLGEKVFERVGKEWVGDVPAYLQPSQFKKCFKENMFMIKLPTVSQEATASAPELLYKLINMVSQEYCDNRDDWLKIVYAMKKCGAGEEFARDWSKKSDRYTEDGFTNAWEQYSAEQITATEGTIRHYAKKSNPEEYAKLTRKPFPTAPTERDYSELFWELAGDCCIVSNNTMYLYYRNQWRIIDKKEPHLLKTMIGNTVTSHFQKYLNNVESRGAISFITSTTEYIKELGKRNKLSNICSFVIDKMYSEHCDTEDVFDKKPYIFAFKNVAFDLQTGTTYQIKKEDYITQNTNNNYTEPTQEEVDVIDKLFTQIFPDPEVRKCYLSVLFIALTGEHPENLFLANGCGRNGKGLLNELMFELMGDYAYKLSIDVLTKDVKKTGANPEIANLHKIRFALANEPEDNDKLNMGTIKDLTGGNETCARGLYSSNTKTVLLMLLLLECNKKPLIAGRIDTSVLERIVDIPFEACFVSNQEDVDEAKHIYLKNIEFKTEAWRQKHYSALFRYLLDHAPAKLYIPPRILQLSKQYVLGSDEMYAWINEFYEFSEDNNDFVKVKDLFDNYKSSDLYSNLTKLEKRNLNKKSFSDLISNHIVLKKQFRNNKTTIAGKSVFCERIHGLKLKPFEEDEDDEEVGHQP